MRTKLIAAFASVYMIWGSTYLAIRYAIQTIPPFLMAATRFLLGGIVLYLWARLDGAKPENARAWGPAFLMGFLLLFMGNGSVVVVEQWVPSGATALMIASTPLWVVLVDWIRPGGRRPGIQTSIGLAVGFAGMVLLIDIGDIRGGGAVDLLGATILMAGCLSWAIGSLYTRHVRISTSPIMTSAMQMLGGGAFLLMTASLTGEFTRFHIENVSRASLLACAYLTVFGAIIAFTAFSWLMKATTPARAATYAYVNPCIAVILGWLIAGEPLTARMLGAMAVIVTAVVVITSANLGARA